MPAGRGGPPCSFASDAMAPMRNLKNRLQTIFENISKVNTADLAVHRGFEI